MVFRKDIASIGNPLDIRITHGSSLIIMPVRCRELMVKIDLKADLISILTCFKWVLLPSKERSNSHLEKDYAVAVTTFLR